MKNKTKSTLSNKIGLKIMLERQKRKLSQEELAELAELSRITIGKLERGESSPSVDTLEKVANALSITLTELMDITKVEL